MAPNNRPAGRNTHVTGNGSVNRRGSGLGTGGLGKRPSGGGLNSGSGPSSGPSSHSGSSHSGGGMPPMGNMGNMGGMMRSGGGGRGCCGAILMGVVVVVGLIFGGTGFLTNMLSGGSSGSYDTYTQSASSGSSQTAQSSQSSTSQSSSYSSSQSSYSSTGSLSSGIWSADSNEGVFTDTVASGVPEKRTQILGGGDDEVTLMVYMCGTDLESKSGMATSDLQEMIAGGTSDKVNLLVYTGGCSKWQNSAVSSSVNQIYQVVDGGLKRVESDMGSAAMTDEDNLAEFITYCGKNYPANRYDLILWDHGGGSVSGYGYDEKQATSDTMTLSEIDRALDKAGISFDFVGFDACLMATYETGIMLADHADYLIASEETEPGIGWYYTEWLKTLNSNTSIPTDELGKTIIDSFTSRCAQQLRGQKTTLSLIDLAELSTTAPAAFSSFAESLSGLILGDSYATVSQARSSSREFAQSSKIDQVDLVDLAVRVGNSEASALESALLGAVKYNRTNNMTNAYGISIYFPCRNRRMVDSAVSLYESLGADEQYTRCISEFAKQNTAGAVAAGGSNSAYSSLFGSGSYTTSGSSSSGSSSLDMSSVGELLTGTYSSGSYETIAQLLNLFMNSTDLSSISDLAGGTASYMSSGKSISLTDEAAAQYAADHSFDASKLVWQTEADGSRIISLSEDQWSLITGVEQNLYYDDGEGYINMGMDNLYSYNEKGDLVADLEGTWAAVNNQAAAYYLTDTTENEDGSFTFSGYMPVLWNDEQAELYVTFDENGYGEVTGISRVYKDGETSAIAKQQSLPEDGDVIEPIAEYYTYDGDFQDTYRIGDAITVDGDLEISNIALDKDALNVTYCFTDIYNESYWTEVLKP